jgi:hypothetical protein
VVARQPKSVNSRRIHGEISESVGRALASRGVAKLGLVFPVDAQKKESGPWAKAIDSRADLKNQTMHHCFPTSSLLLTLFRIWFRIQLTKAGKINRIYLISN